jgi:hypothetical protein
VVSRVVKGVNARVRAAARRAVAPVWRRVEPPLVVRRWQRAGRPVPPPPAVKVREVRSYLRRYRPPVFVETGTFFGDTTAAVARDVRRAVTIELSPELARRARERFATRANVTVLEGDSGELLPDLLSTLEEPALFWLDGHYSAGVTARGPEETPVRTELEAILAHSIKQHVILIDDARDFTGGAYPSLSEIEEVVRRAGDAYELTVDDDIIRLTPRALPASR